MEQDWTKFTVNIAVKATLKDIYDAWTKAEKMEQWFLETCKYLDSTQLIDKNKNAETNNSYEWTWYLYDVIEKGIVKHANGKDFFQFTFAGECLVDVHLVEQNEYVLVTLTQKDIPTDEYSKFNIRIGCFQGWGFYLVNLKSVYETGYDLRNKTPEFIGINN